MKSIPANSAVMAALQANTPVLLDETVNDAIVDSILAGKVFPGDLVYHSDEHVISPELQEQLTKRFAAAGWQLHFRTGTTQHPHVHAYIAGEDARYLPVIKQPSGYGKRPVQRSWSEKLLQLFPQLFARLRPCST